MSHGTKQTSDAIMDIVKRRPKRSHDKLPSAGDPALQYILTITPASNRNWELKQIVGELPGFDLDHAGPTSMSVVHSGRWTSTKISDAGMAGRNATYIEAPDGGFAYADHTDRLSFHADKEQVVPLAPPGAVQSAIDIQSGERIEGRRTKIATVDITAPAPMRLRIWFIDDTQFQPFSRAVFTRLVGCPDRLRRSGLDASRLEELGTPVRVESHASVAGEGREPLVISTATELRLGQARSADFEVPSEYHDLRDVQTLAARLGPRGFKGSSGRLSSLRSGGSKDQQTDLGRPVNPAPAGSAYIYNPIRIPQCLPSTFAAQIAVETDQALYNDLRFLINNVFSRFSSFSGSNGVLKVDWLSQWASSPNVLAGDDGLFCLMRDPANLTQSPPHLGGTGLLDKLAENKARAAMLDGSITSIGLSLPPALLAQVVAALATSPNQRFDSLPPDSQAQLRDLYLTQLIGQFTVTYPTSTPATTTFHGLINVQLSDVEFTIGINYTQPMTSLDTGNNVIRTHFALPAVTGTANIARWPTGLYWAALGATGLACLFLPFLCWLLPFVAAVGLFLLSDYAWVRVEIDNFTADAALSFQPDTQQVLRPQAAVQLDGDVSVWYISYIPTGLNQLASFVYSLVGSHTDIVINLIEGQLQDLLNKLLAQTLNLSFPPQFGSVPITGIRQLHRRSVGRFPIPRSRPQCRSCRRVRAVHHAGRHRHRNPAARRALAVDQ